MHTVKPLTSLTDDDIRDMAQAAADRGDSQANVFPADTRQHQLFNRFHGERENELQGLVTA